jgi:hypothetical protein
VTVPLVLVRPWVHADVSKALSSRPALGRVLFDLHNHLPNNLPHYQSRRISRSPRCFWYSRLYSEQNKLYKFDFVVRDADPSVLDVIWVIITM